MDSLLNTLNLSLAVSSLCLLGATAVLAIDYFVYHGRYLQGKIKPFLWPMIIYLTIGSVAMSLVYSEHFGFVPCSLCWLQRIALYPQALLAVIALRQHDARYFPLYGIALSIFGLLAGIYHYIYQQVPRTAGTSSVLPCLADGSADCAEKVMNVFGFITFPFVSIAAFAFLIMVYLYLRRSERDS